MKSENEGPSMLLAFVRRVGAKTEGVVLDATDSFLAHVEEIGSWDLEDVNPREKAPRTGLLVFEGWLDVSRVDPTDVALEGGWRELTHWELMRLRFGSPLAALRVR